jgi:hypothetical protein
MRTLSILRYTYIARLVQSSTTAVYGGVWLASPQATVYVVRGTWYVYCYENGGGVQTRLEITLSTNLLHIVWLSHRCLIIYN